MVGETFNSYPKYVNYKPLQGHQIGEVFSQSRSTVSTKVYIWIVSCSCLDQWQAATGCYTCMYVLPNNFHQRIIRSCFHEYIFNIILFKNSYWNHLTLLKILCLWFGPQPVPLSPWTFLWNQRVQGPNVHKCSHNTLPDNLDIFYNVWTFRTIKLSCDFGEFHMHCRRGFLQKFYCKKNYWMLSNADLSLKTVFSGKIQGTKTM